MSVARPYVMRFGGWLATACLVLAGCNKVSAPTETVASAKELLKSEQPAAAVIQLKNVLQADPKSGEARFLLGQAFALQGDHKSAIVELRKALELGYSDTATVPLLARAMLDFQQHKALIKEFESVRLNDDRAQGKLLSTLALALAREGGISRASASIEDAERFAPDDNAVLLAKARVLALRGKVDEALTIVDALNRREPKAVEPWLLKADLLLFAKNDRPSAEKAYQAALSLQPNRMALHQTLFAMYAAANDLAAAKRQQEAMAKLFPNHPQTLFAAAQLAAVDGDFKKARELTQGSLKFLGESPLVLQFAGYVELALNSLTQAEKLLSKAIQLEPASRRARQLLATVHLRSNSPGKAIDILRPVLDSQRPDAESLALMAEGYLQLGDAKTAEQLFTQAGSLKPDDSRVRTALALLQVGKGKADMAFDELRATAASTADTFPDMALISAYIHKKDFDAALKAIDSLQKKSANSPLPELLRGRIQLALKRTEQARESFSKALTKDPVYLPALAALASMDLADGKPKEAEQRFADSLKANPQNLVATLAVAELKIRGGAEREEIVKLLEGAVRNHPSEVSARLKLIRYLTSIGDTKAALSAAQSGVAANAENPILLMSLGELQAADGDVNQSITSFGKAAAAMPRSATPLLKLVAAQLAVKDTASAEKSAKRAFELEPTSVAAVRALATVLGAQKRVGEVVALARQFQRTSPKSPAGYQLEGDALLLLKSDDAALKAYRKGLEQTGGGILPEKVMQLLGRLKGPAEAKRFYDEWQAKHPSDDGLPMFLGNSALAAGDWTTSEMHFREVLRLNSGNSAAMNNLAWTLAKASKPGATEWAEKAVAANPGSLSYLDTLAYALASERKFPKAIETAKTLVSRAPNLPASRLSLARVYVMAAEKQLAKVELDILEKLSDKSLANKEVDDLRKAVQ